MGTNRINILKYAKGEDYSNHLCITFKRDQETGEIVIIRSEPINEEEDFFISIAVSKEDVEFFDNLPEEKIYRALKKFNQLSHE